jgi:hypothetical protein
MPAARHITIKREADRDWEAHKDHFRKNVYGVLRECEGFQACLFLIDRETGEEIGMTLWDTEENMRASGEVLQAARKERLGDAAEKEEYPVEKRFMEVALFETS